MILCCGEALIDFMPFRDSEAQTAYRSCPGGSPLNTAVALGRLGTSVGFLSGISQDLFGNLLVSHLEESGVNCSLLCRVDHDTTLAFVSAKSVAGEVEYAFYAKETADRSLKLTDLPSCLPESVRALQFGSVSLVMEPTASTLEALMLRESPHRLISLDPNIRPNLIPDRTAYRMRFEGWLAQVHLLKASVTDLAWIYPGENFSEVISRIMSRRVQAVFLTDGEKGAWVYTRNQRVFAEAVSVNVLDTVGAGDSFHAAILHKLAELNYLDPGGLDRIGEEDLGICLRFANKVAALTCTRAGADPPRKSEVV